MDFQFVRKHFAKAFHIELHCRNIDQAALVLVGRSFLGRGLLRCNLVTILLLPLGVGNATFDISHLQPGVQIGYSTCQTPEKPNILLPAANLEPGHLTRDSMAIIAAILMGNGMKEFVARV